MLFAPDEVVTDRNKRKSQSVIETLDANAMNTNTNIQDNDNELKTPEQNDHSKTEQIESN